MRCLYKLGARLRLGVRSRTVVCCQRLPVNVTDGCSVFRPDRTGSTLCGRPRPTRTGPHADMHTHIRMQGQVLMPTCTPTYACKDRSSCRHAHPHTHTRTGPHADMHTHIRMHTRASTSAQQAIQHQHAHRSTHNPLHRHTHTDLPHYCLHRHAHRLTHNRLHRHTHRSDRHTHTHTSFVQARFSAMMGRFCYFFQEIVSCDSERASSTVIATPGTTTATTTTTTTMTAIYATTNNYCLL
jgi:hypothetical protein